MHISEARRSGRTAHRRRALAAIAVAAVLTPVALTAPAAAAAPAAPGHAATAPSAAAYPELPDGSRAEKTLVIGLDGSMLEKIEQAEAPHLKSLIAQGTRAPSSLYDTSVAKTESGPGWATVLTGTWPDKHGVRDNSFDGKDFGTYPDFLTRMEQADPELSTLAIASWAPITSAEGNGEIVGGDVDVRIATPGDEYDAGTTERAVYYLGSENPDATFVQLDNIDHAGHSSGSDSQEYLDAIAGVDEQIGRMLDAVRSRATYDEESWQIMVTADHGHRPEGGHGGNSDEERATYVIGNGPGFRPGTTRDDVEIVDIAATALKHEGVAVPDGLDGVPVDEK